MNFYKTASLDILHAQHHRFDDMRRHLAWVYAESDRLSDVAQHELYCARVSVRLQLELIDAELSIRRGMGLGTQPLTPLADAPTAIAS